MCHARFRWNQLSFLWVLCPSAPPYHLTFILLWFHNNNNNSKRKWNFSKEFTDHGQYNRISVHSNEWRVRIFRSRQIIKLNQRVEEEEKNTRIIYHTLFFLYPWGLINSISWMHYLRSLFKKAKRIRWNYLTYSHAMHSAPWSDKRKLCSLAHIQKTPCT